MNDRYRAIHNPKRARMGLHPWAVVCVRKMRVIWYYPNEYAAKRAARTRSAAERQGVYVSAD